MTNTPTTVENMPTKVDQLRFADPHNAERYPLPVAGACVWQRQNDGWITRIDLADLPAGSILAPSLSVLSDEPYGFQFTLFSGARGSWPLPCTPRNEATPDASTRRVRTVLDCYHILKPLRNVRIEVSCRAAKEPENYLLVLSVRPVELPPDTRPPEAAACLQDPPRRSQMLENPRIASRICSPMAAGMVIGHHGHAVDWRKFLADCYDPVTKMYGMWPLAIRAASHYGCLGAVELLDSWDDVRQCLAANLPVVASIRFAQGQIPEAPLAATGGHLIVVHAVNPDVVRVNDPAAPNHGTVTRCYSTPALAEAWFRHRGAAYILLP